MTVAPLARLPIERNITLRWRAVPVHLHEHTCRQHSIEEELTRYRIAERHRLRCCARVGRLKAQDLGTCRAGVGYSAERHKGGRKNAPVRGIVWIFLSRQFGMVQGIFVIARRITAYGDEGVEHGCISIER